jgi:hypothetical protein
VEQSTLDRKAAIRAAGFEVARLDRGFHAPSPRAITSAPYVLGVARR